ncbi:MAG TPA: phage tail sheath C-terminal domain-containing protein [Acidobacteriaceae bacterium]|nr:phage tail sheath C-terminal domain-containing protein [Acidobacteriaceae bacterium]
MPTYLTPGVYFESVDSASAEIAAIRTDVAAFVGVAAQGPVHRATPVESWVQFLSTFGGFLPNAYLAYAANAFFQNGGSKLYVVRVAAPHVTTMTNPAFSQPADGSASTLLSVQGFAVGAVATAQQTAAASSVGVQPADRMSTLVDAIAGFSQGSLVQITQQTPFFLAWHTVQDVDAGAKRLFWDSPLEAGFLLTVPMLLTSFHHADLVVAQMNPASKTVSWVNGLGSEFNVSQPIEFDTGVSASRGVFKDEAGLETLRIEASSPGSWGDTVAVSVSHSSLAATASSSAPQPASGAYSFVESVVGFSTASLVRLYQTQASLPVVGYRVVTAVNPTNNFLQWDMPLTPAFDVTQPLSFETLEFALTIFVDGSAKETFTGLSLNPSHPRYVENVVNPRSKKVVIPPQTGMPSQSIRVKNLHSPASYPNNLPDPSAPQLKDGVLSLWGGRDGVAALQILDFIGDPASTRKSGIRSFEDVDEISIVAAPDILIEPTPAVIYTAPPVKTVNPCLPCSTVAPSVSRPVPPTVEAAPQFSLDEVFQVQQALIAHCELMQYRFAILDPPDFGYPQLHVDLAKVQSWRQQFDTMYAALYYPWLMVLDPLQAGRQVVRRIPPSGHVAGVYANTDLTVGVHQAPANSAMQWVQSLTNQVTPEMQAFLNPLSINCIRAFPGRGIRVYGARTLSSDASWIFVNVRRLVSMIEHALEILLQWAVFEPNNVHLWNLIRTAATNYLESVWQKGGLMGNTAADAFYVICDQTSNTLATTSVGQMIAEIGVAPTVPAEFVVFRLGQVQDALEVMEA